MYKFSQQNHLLESPQPSQRRGTKQPQRAHVDRRLSQILLLQLFSISPLDDLSSGGLGGCRRKGRKVCPREQGGCRAASLTRSSRRHRSHEGSWIRRKGAEDMVQYGGRTDGFVQQKQEEKMAWRRVSRVRVQSELCLKVPVDPICLQPVPALSQCGQNLSAPAENWNPQNAAAQTVSLSSLAAKLHHHELGNQNNCNIQTLLHHHHRHASNWCVFTFAPAS